VLAIGDVVGKGPRAALSTAVVAAAFHRLAKTGFEDPRAALTEMDDALKATFRGKQNTTLSLAAVRRDGIQVFACGAPHWLHARAGGAVEPVRTKPSKLLGMELGTATFHDATVTLAPGDLLIAYTDGVMEGMVLRGRFQRALAEALKAKPEATFAEVQATVERIATELGKTMGVEDDFTLLVIQRRYGVPVRRSETEEIEPTSASAAS
jgi:serine phosphatase RsbU (regulator of sigma subunit)